MIERILVFLAALTVKHFIADFLLQSDEMVKKKGTHLNTLLLHSLHHAVATIGIVWFFFDLWSACIIALIEIGIHSLIDGIKSNPRFLGTITLSNKKFFPLLGLDQLMHMFTYLLFAYLLFDGKL
ncbi:MAG: DUF3307 domain-containing protein [Patescibacteria group bacterium]